MIGLSDRLDIMELVADSIWSPQEFPTIIVTKDVLSLQLRIILLNLRRLD